MPYLPNMGCLTVPLEKVIVWPAVGNSGVSSASALSAGEDSTPDISERRSWSKGFRGVVNDGLRKAGAGVEDAPMKELVGLDSNPPIKESVFDTYVYVDAQPGMNLPLGP